MSRLILITGSRHATPPMLAIAREVVIWVALNRYELVCGEAPGVDEAARRVGEEVGLRPHVYGANGRFRQPEINPKGERRIIVPGGYYARDRVMGDRCSVCIALWNGKRRNTSGTVYTGEYVESLGKPVKWPFASPHVGKTRS